MGDERKSTKAADRSERMVHGMSGISPGSGDSHPEWKQALSQASFMFRERDICFSDFDGIFYEHLIVYFIYRYFLNPSMTFSFWIRLNLRFSAVWLSGGQRQRFHERKA